MGTDAISTPGTALNSPQRLTGRLAAPSSICQSRASPFSSVDCGASTRPLTYPESEACNLHVAFITNSTKHYHKNTTEVYYILEGRGKMELNDDVIDIEPGLVILIEPGTAHRLYSAEGVRTIVFGVPAYRDEDEFYVRV